MKKQIKLEILKETFNTILSALDNHIECLKTEMNPDMSLIQDAMKVKDEILSQAASQSLKTASFSVCPVCKSNFPVRSGKLLRFVENGVSGTVLICRKKNCAIEMRKESLL